MRNSHRRSSTPTNRTMLTSLTPRRSHHRTVFEIRSRQSFLPDQASDSGDSLDDALLDLIKRTWAISAVSPLFGLDCNDDVKLKQYAKRLRENVATSLSQENFAYEAKFEILKELVSHPADPPALQVQVHSKKDEDDKITCIYQGIFLSWGERRETEKDNVKLPILLSRGTITVTRTVHSILCRMFDCLITAMPASQEDLKWLTAIILNSADKPARRKRGGARNDVILEYQLPGRRPSDTINISFPLASMVTLWSKICPTHPSSLNPDEQVASIIELEQVKKLFQCIRIQVTGSATMEMGYCLLNRISLPSLTMKFDKIKATNVDTMDRVLWFFQEKALLYSPTLVLAANNEED